MSDPAIPGAHPVSGPVVMRSFGLLQVGQRSRSASSSLVTNAAGFYCSRLTLAQLYLSFSQHADDLFCRVPLPCHSIVSSSEVRNSRIRSIRMVPSLGSRPGSEESESRARPLDGSHRPGSDGDDRKNCSSDVDSIRHQPSRHVTVTTPELLYQHA